MGFDQPVHWVVLLILAGLLFGGYKKLPEMARSAGRSMRVFKTELKGMADDDQARANATTYPQPGAPAQPGVTASPVSRAARCRRSARCSGAIPARRGRAAVATRPS